MTLSSHHGSSSCILTPEFAIGPHLVTASTVNSFGPTSLKIKLEYPVHLEFQFVDYTICEGVENMMVDALAANATGVYSGVDVSDNEASVDTTYLRGLQATDFDGVASFDTIFPGHYKGRAIRQHVVSHYNYTLLPNNTIVG
jgi:protocatechuate 3,4-dioxygenase beta subunit